VVAFPISLAPRDKVNFIATHNATKNPAKVSGPGGVKSDLDIQDLDNETFKPMPGRAQEGIA
jgi:hypothetical protein